MKIGCSFFVLLWTIVAIVLTLSPEWGRSPIGPSLLGRGTGLASASSTGILLSQSYCLW